MQKLSLLIVKYLGHCLHVEINRSYELVVVWTFPWSIGTSWQFVWTNKIGTCLSVVLSWFLGRKCGSQRLYCSVWALDWRCWRLCFHIIFCSLQLLPILPSLSALPPTWLRVCAPAPYFFVHTKRVVLLTEGKFHPQYQEFCLCLLDSLVKTTTYGSWPVEMGIMILLS